MARTADQPCHTGTSADSASTWRSPQLMWANGSGRKLMTAACYRGSRTCRAG